MATGLAIDHFLRGEHAVANGWVRRAHRLLEGIEQCPEFGWLATVEAHIAIMADHDPASAQRFSAEAVSLGKSLGDLDLEMLALAYEGFALVSQGKIAEGMRRLDESTIAAVSGEMSDIDAITTACCCLIHACDATCSEWLGAMVVGRIVEHDPEDKTYRLPQEHVAFLTRAASPDNIAAFAQYIPLLGSVEDGIVESFKHGGGVPYSAFPRFHEVVIDETDQTVIAALTDHILLLVPGLTERLEDGIDVLDVGRGSGRALNLMARTFPNSRFSGYDFSEEAIARARAEAEGHGTTNVRFEVKDVATLDEEARYDLIATFDAVHDQAKPAKVLKGIADVLKDNGVYLMQDIVGSSHLHNNMDHPIGPFLYTASTMHCMTVYLAQGGERLGTMWGEEKAREMLEEAGFAKVEVEQLPHDFTNNYFIVTKG